MRDYIRLLRLEDFIQFFRENKPSYEVDEVRYYPAKDGTTEAGVYFDNIFGMFVFTNFTIRARREDESKKDLWNKRWRKFLLKHEKCKDTYAEDLREFLVQEVDKQVEELKNSH